MKIKIPISILLPSVFLLTTLDLVAQHDQDSIRVTLEEVVISVNKTEESTRRIAQQVQSLPAEELTKRPYMSTADVLASSGNISVQKSQFGGGSPVIRGFEASRILLVVDGVRLNNLIYRAGHLQNILTLDHESLDRLEVLFGPSSTIYGSDALGGVIHMYTKSPQLATENRDAFRLSASGRYGSAANEMTGHVDFNLGSAAFASFTSLTGSNFDDLRGGASSNPFYETPYGERPYYVERINDADSLVANSDRFLQVQSGYKQFDILQKFLYKPGRTSHGLNLQMSGSTDVPRYDRLTDPAGSGLRFAEWYYGPQDRILAAYDFDRTDAGAFFQNIHAGVNYQAVEESRHQRRFGNDTLQHRFENVDAYGASVHATRTSGQHQLRTGLDLFYSTVVSTAHEEDIVTGEMSPLDTRYPGGDNNQFHGAIYYSHTWEFSPGWFLNDGIRLGYSALNSSFTDTTFFRFPFTEVSQENPVYSGSLGLVRTPNETWKYSLLVSTGYRVPNIDDLAKVFESGSGTLVVPNPELEPEKTLNLEAGISVVLHKNTRWDNTVYFTRFYDAIVTAPYSYEGQDSVYYDGSWSAVVASQNMRNATLYGFTSNLRSSPVRNLELRLNLTYTHGEIKEDTGHAPLDHIPPFLIQAQASWKHKNIGVDFWFQYQGWKRLEDYYPNGEDNEQYATPEGMPAWYTLNILGRYQFTPQISLAAGVENILDTQYRTFASGINAPGRNVTVAIRFKM